MSIQAIAWVFSQDITPAHTKLVMIALANYCNDDGLAWPSIETISNVTSQDRKTVIRALQKLQEKKLIVDTGRKAGKTWRVNVYRLIVPDTVLLKLRNSTVRDRKQYRPRPETVPSTVLRTYKEPLKNLGDKSPAQQTAEELSENLAKLMSVKQAIKS